MHSLYLYSLWFVFSWLNKLIADTTLQHFLHMISSRLATLGLNQALLFGNTFDFQTTEGDPFGG